jgi:hypothetical protein
MFAVKNNEVINCVSVECVIHQTAVRIWSQPFTIDSVKTPNGKEFLLYNVPFYYVGVVGRILKTRLLSMRIC